MVRSLLSNRLPMLEGSHRKGSSVLPSTLFPAISTLYFTESQLINNQKK